MNRIFAILLLAFVICFDASAQLRDIKTYDDKKRSTVLDKPSQRGGKTLRGQSADLVKPIAESQPMPDTILCTATRKIHGWFAPLDTLTPEAAAHINGYARLTNRNKAGNWQRLECINAYGDYAEGLFSAYILSVNCDEADSGADPEWFARIKSACIFETISDPSGREVIQDRAYDKNKNLVYTFSITPIGNNQYIGSYRDAHGLPAEMRKPEDYKYGTLVRITRDRWGNDSVIQFTDAYGRIKPNIERVAKEINIYDEFGRQLKQMSCNADGSLAINNRGVCGKEIEWDGCMCRSFTYMDKNWQPIRVKDPEYNYRKNIIRSHFERDEYGRITEEYFTDQFDNPDVNAYGTHRIVLEFDDWGNVIKRVGYDRDGNLSAIDHSLVATQTTECDQQGRPLRIVLTDIDGQLSSTPGFLSRMEWEYDDQGNQRSFKEYFVKDGKEKIYYLEEDTSDRHYHIYSDGSSRVDSLDAKGRTVFTGYYDADGHLEVNDTYAYERVSFVEDGPVTISTDIIYDNNHNLVNNKVGCNREVCVIDSLGWTKTFWKYDKDGVLIEAFKLCYAPGFHKITQEYDINAFGAPCRGGGTAGARFYNAVVSFNPNGEQVAICNLDEFGEPDYMTTSDDKIYVYNKVLPRYGWKFYDEDDKEVDNVAEIRDRLYKVLSIEVVDSAAYRRGLRDNDVIIAYGDYCVNLDSVDSFSEFKRDWTLRSVLDADRAKRMVVFRIEDAAAGKYGLVEIDSLTGTASDLGFMAHIRYLTRRQAARIRQSITDNVASDTPLLTKEDLGRKTPKGPHTVMLGSTELFRSKRQTPYPKYVTDPSLLLGCCVKDAKLKWTTLDDGAATDGFVTILNTRSAEADRYPNFTFFVTKDGSDLTVLDSDERYIYVNWFTADISDEDYARLLPLYEKAKADIDALLRQPSAIPAKDLIGYWEFSSAGSPTYPVNGYFCLDKDGTAFGEVTEYGEASTSHGVLVFKKTSYCSGPWQNGGNWLFLPPECDMRMECVDILDYDEESKAEALANVNKWMDRDPEYPNLKQVFRSIDFHHGLNRDAYIYSWDKKSFMTSDSVVFTKAKMPKGLKPHVAETPSADVAPDTNLPDDNNIEIVPDNPLLGYWTSSKDGLEVDIMFAQDGSISSDFFYSDKFEPDSMVVTMSVYFTMSGKWSIINDSTINKVFDPATVDARFVYDIKGANEQDTQRFLEAVKNEDQKFEDRMVMGILKETNADDIESWIELPDSTTLVMNGVTWRRPPERKDIAISQIQMDGYLAEKGFGGRYVLLEFLDWDMLQGLTALNETFANIPDRDRHMVLMTVEENGDLGSIVEVTCPPVKAGIEVHDMSVPYRLYKYILYKYIDHKASLKILRDTTPR